MDDQDRLTYYATNRAPNIVRRLSSQSGDFDVVAGQTFRLRVRPVWSSSIILDQPMTADVDADTLTYAPSAGDFAVEGLYKAWVYVELTPGIPQDTDEFEIMVRAHAPGEGVVVGAVYRAARALEPVAWDSLVGYPDYGDIELQRVIELAKLRVLRTSADIAAENALDPRVVDYIAKKALVDNVLSAAISFWTNQVVQQTARGNSEEVQTFPDRIRATQDAILRYRSDLDRQQGEVDEILGAVGTVLHSPALLGGGALITPGLEDYAWSSRRSTGTTPPAIVERGANGWGW